MRDNMAPPVYENWIAALEGQPAFLAQEFPLFTDADILGTITEGYGPYQLLNTVPWLAEYQVLRPSIILRLDYHKVYDPSSAVERTNYVRYHGGALQDEIAALVSLCLGIRLKAGGATRRFEPNGDPRGFPEAFEVHKDPLLPRGFEGLIIPHAIGNHSLDTAVPLTTIPMLLAEDAIALIRAARLYQDGLWLAEAQPELAWLMLVSAVETAAGHWRTANEQPLNRLRASKPDLEHLLRQVGDDEFVLKVAAELAPYMGSTKKFESFIMEFLPEPAQERPVEFARHPWTARTMKQTMNVIYNYRSRALHDGTPFPAPMCIAPKKFGETNVYAEIPWFGGMSVRGGAWLKQDTPMLLHTFEYIVRNVLIKWWQSMVK